MVFSWKEPHLILKFVTLILLLLTIFTTIQPSGSWSHSLIVEGLTNTSATVIFVLIISIVYLGSPRVTEICLIVSVLAMLIICCSLWCSGGDKVQLVEATTINGYYVVFPKASDRRYTYIGLTLPCIILEAVDVILHAMNK